MASLYISAMTRELRAHLPVSSGFENIIRGTKLSPSSGFDSIHRIHGAQSVYEQSPSLLGPTAVLN
jgi:hypothetical protein